MQGLKSKTLTEEEQKLFQNQGYVASLDQYGNAEVYDYGAQTLSLSKRDMYASPVFMPPRPPPVPFMDQDQDETPNR